MTAGRFAGFRFATGVLRSLDRDSTIGDKYYTSCYAEM